jgi:HKD family nuclease
MSEEKGSAIVREGVRGLYSTTPFKIFRYKKGESFSIPIVPVAYLQLDPQIEWCSTALADQFPAEVRTRDARVFDKIVCHPYEVFSQVFRQGDGKKFTLRADVNARQYPPAYAEYSYESLTNGRYCRLGWVFLSSQPTCPLEQRCKYRKRSPCMYYNTRPLAYSSMYTIYPRIKKHFEDASAISTPIVAVRFNDKPLSVFRLIEEAESRFWIDAAEFNTRNVFMRWRPVLYLKKGLGFRIRNIQALELEFIPDTLKQFLRETLNTSPELARWICLKKILFEENGLIREKAGYKAFRRMKDEFASVFANGDAQAFQESAIGRRLADPLRESDIIEFAEFLTLHTLAHTLKHALSIYIGCDEDELQYAVDHPFNPVGSSTNRVRIVIFELAVGGLGYLKGLAQALKTDKNEYFEFTRILDDQLRSLEKHSHQTQRNISNIRQSLERYSSRELADSLLRIYDSRNIGIYPHVNAARETVAEARQGLTEEEEAELDDMLSHAPLCWDGCQLCVVAERGCTFLPYDQPFLVAVSPVIAISKVILESMKSPTINLHFRRGVTDVFNSFLNSSRSSIEVSTPWISTDSVDLLLNCARRGVAVRVLTSADKSLESHKLALDRLAKIASTQFTTKIADFAFVHSKGMLVDDCMVLSGSFNLTRNGLESNIENLTIDYSVEGSHDFKEGFEELWAKSQNLT